MTVSTTPTQGWQGWDAYAPFYDWENARTVGRRDVRFWVDLAGRVQGSVLELGCGTGRLSLPVARASSRFVGVDRSSLMLEKLRIRFKRARLASRASIVRGDIRELPFRKRTRFSLVMAPYGMMQSILKDDDIRATLKGVAAVLPRGGLFGIDLVPELLRWEEYQRQVSFEGQMESGRHVTLIESVRQDRRRQLTIFDQEFLERFGERTTRHCFSLVFRTLSVSQLSEHLQSEGFRIDAVLGDYCGTEWSPDAEVWIMLARKC